MSLLASLYLGNVWTIKIFTGSWTVYPFKIWISGWTFKLIHNFDQIDILYPRYDLFFELRLYQRSVQFKSLFFALPLSKTQSKYSLWTRSVKHGAFNSTSVRMLPCTVSTHICLSKNLAAHFKVLQPYQVNYREQWVRTVEKLLRKKNNLWYATKLKLL